jgi:hypothetical protein
VERLNFTTFHIYCNVRHILLAIFESGTIEFNYIPDLLQCEAWHRITVILTEVYCRVFYSECYREALVNFSEHAVKNWSNDWSQMELILYLKTIRGRHCYRVLLIITKRRLDTQTKSVQLLNSMSTEVFAEQRCKGSGRRCPWTWRPHHLWKIVWDYWNLLVEPNWFPIFCVKNEKNPKPVSRE